MGKTTALDIANFFIDLSSYDEDNDMTNMKVNKLVYFAQGWSLAILGKPLFDENIEAWEHGPVVESVYKAFKPCGRNLIDSTYGDYDESNIDRDIGLFLLDVYSQYNKYSASELRNMTHKMKTPWRKVYAPNKNCVISNDDMQEYFTNNDHLDRFDIKNVIEKTPIITKRSKDGYIVLPKEWDDEV